MILAALPLFGLGAMAQSKVDLGSRAIMRASKAKIEITQAADGSAKVRQRTAVAPGASIVQGFIYLKDGADASVLEAVGVTVNKVRGKMVLAEFPQSILGDVEALPEVTKITLAKPLNRKMDRVREVTGIDKIHTGLDLPQAYTGKGVVTGLVDGGFDPNHLNFRNADGSSRISRFTYYRPTQDGGYVEEIYGSDYMPNIDTETDETYHGTHTLGIMAGGYRGQVTAGVAKNLFEGEVVTIDNPYYGAAYESDIALACGALNDYYIAMGIETILNYAYDLKIPAVINLSLGSNVGPHDGTSTICQYLDAVSEADRVIFCVSAGNEGDMPIAINKTFTADDKTVASCLYPAVPMTDYQNVRYGKTYIYSDSPTQFDVQALVINKKRNAVAMRMPLSATDGAVKYWVSSADYKTDDSDVVSAMLGKYIEGYIGVGAEFDAESGRYYAVLDYMCWDNLTGNKSGNYIIGFQVTGSEGQRVDIFCDGIYNNLDDYGLSGYTKGSSDGSISDVACGHNYVTVGSFNTRDDWASVDGYIYGYQGDFPVGEISSFSSYGRLFDGRELPTVCAPGAAIISSSNEYFLKEAEADDSALQAKVTDDDRTYSWHQSVGTSMASPVVAGAVALWLEADPELKYADVIDIIKKTAVRDDVVAAGNSVKWGAGKFDAYAGLKEVLERKNAGICTVSADNAASDMVVSAVAPRSFRVMVTGVADGFNLSLYNVGGAKVRAYSADSSELTVDASDLPAGIYILNVDGTACSSRICVK